MKPLPKSDQALVVRTDFSDDTAWTSVVSAIKRPVDGFFAYVDFVDDPAFGGLTVEQLVALRDGLSKSYVIVADAVTMSAPEPSLLVVDLFEEPGRTFRAVPSAIQSIENNLSIANMDFWEFADNVDADGVFRDFK
jgi:hypothetical protein